MTVSLQRTYALLVLLCLPASLASGTAYEGRPKLIVIIIIDQFRGDYPERYRDGFGENGFRLFLDRGAAFVNCNFEYANTHTAPGHATLFTGAYSDGHGIAGNAWWDPERQRVVTSVSDPATKLVGAAGEGASPHNLRADTLGDELKLATGGRSRVFAISLKDRGAVLPGGYSADAAYWIDRQTGAWITSSYYMNELPSWVQEINQQKRADLYWDMSWVDANNQVLRSTARQPGKGWYDIVGSTPFANDYQLDFARELITHEKLGTGPNTDLLAISLSANDILGHQVGPDSPEMQAMAIGLDRTLATFTSFLGRQLGLAKVWIVLSADHGMAPLPAYASKLRLPAANFDAAGLLTRLNRALSARFGAGDYIKHIEWPVAYLSEPAFAKANLKEAEAERAVAAKLLTERHVQAAYTRSQLEEGRLPPTTMGRKYAHSYSPYGGWYVVAVPAPFHVGYPTGGDHGTPYIYDTHVPLYFYGLAFRPGIYRTHCETVDMSATLASLLGINAPSAAIGRVLTEALAPMKEAAP
jgi:predicted AlkP superfamily pyrophosphatase or phosphodiesterase